MAKKTIKMELQTDGEGNSGVRAVTQENTQEDTEESAAQEEAEEGQAPEGGAGPETEAEAENDLSAAAQKERELEAEKNKIPVASLSKKEIEAAKQDDCRKCLDLILPLMSDGNDESLTDDHLSSKLGMNRIHANLFRELAKRGKRSDFRFSDGNHETLMNEVLRLKRKKHL